MPTIEELLLGKPLEEALEAEEAIEVAKGNLQDEVLSVEESVKLLGLKTLPSEEEVIRDQIEQDGGMPAPQVALKIKEEPCQEENSQDEVHLLRDRLNTEEITPVEAVEQLKKMDKESPLPFSVAVEFVGYKEKFLESKGALRPLGDDELLQKAQEEQEKNVEAIEILTGEIFGNGVGEMARMAEAKKEPEPRTVTTTGTLTPTQVENLREVKDSCDYETLDLNDLGVQMAPEGKPVGTDTEFIPEGGLKVVGESPSEKPILEDWQVGKAEHEDLSSEDQIEGPFAKDPEEPVAPYDPSDTEHSLVKEAGFEDPHTLSPHKGAESDLVGDIGFDEDLPAEVSAPQVDYRVVDQVPLRHGRVVLIDGSNMAMRCFFPLKDMCRSDGRPTGLLFGMLKSIRAIQRDCNALPVLVWDAGGTKKKREIYADYKGNRGESDIKSACFGELDNVKEWLRYLGIPQVRAEGEEADDVIGSLAYGTFKDAWVFIYSSDDDFLQLVDDKHCIVVKPSKEGPVFYDSEKVKERLGVTPDLVPMYRCLRGDTSDNLPGIPRFQSKKIVELVTAHNTIEDLWSDPEENFKGLTKKAKEKISVFREQAEINLKIMTIDRDIKPDIQVADFSESSLRDLFEEMEFSSFLEVFDEWVAEFRGGSGFVKTG